jgi:hypothetical protein
MKLPTKAGLLFLALGLAWLVLPRQTDADLQSDWFRKFPWTAGEQHVITTLPYQEEHCCGSTCNNGAPGECADAYDFVIANDDVRSSIQGPIAQAETDVRGCGPNLHYGNHVLVQTTYHQVTYVSYAHLETVMSTLSPYARARARASPDTTPGMTSTATAPSTLPMSTSWPPSSTSGATRPRRFATLVGDAAQVIIL